MKQETTTNQRLRELMDEMGLSQADVSVATGIAKSSLSQILRGARACGPKIIRDVVKAYPKVNLHWLRDGEGNMFVEDNTSVVDRSKGSYGISVKEADVDDLNITYGGSSYKDSVHFVQQSSEPGKDEDMENIKKRCLSVLEQANKMLDTINGLTASLVATAQQQQEQYKRIDEMYQRLTDAHDGHVARSNEFLQGSVKEIQSLRNSFHEEIEKLNKQNMENTMSIKKECATFRPTKRELETMLQGAGEA